MRSATATPAANGGNGDVVVDVQKMVGGGRGLAHHAGETWMVAAALPGERVRAAVEGRRAGVVMARAIEILDSTGAGRNPEPCPHAPECGGCDWPHVAPDLEGSFKAGVAAEAARNIPELAGRIAAAPVRGSPLSYRLRSRLHWDPTSGFLGFYACRTWRVVTIPSCRIVSPRLAANLEGLSSMLKAHCPAPVDLEWLEDLEGRCAVAALRPARRGPRDVDPAWLPGESDARGAVDGLHLLDRRGRRTGGWGLEAVTMSLPVAVSVPIGSFFQVNRHLAGWMFNRVVELIGADALPTWDLHAGVGYLAAAAHHAAPRELHLVEPFPPAALAAQASLPMASVAVGSTAEAYLKRQRQLPGEALVLTDPPRAGMTPVLGRQLAAWRPRRIVMLACDPATWSRDARFLIKGGFRLAHLELVDLFPSTHHVEILAVLERG